MKKFLFRVAVLCFAVSGFADTNVNNFIGYHDWWGPFGNPNTATYGEVFTTPTNGDDNLSIFSFYMGSAAKSGDIVTGAYIATWTGTHAGELVYSSQRFDYDNYGDEEFVNNTYGLNLQAGADYVMFLSVSQYYGQSKGESFISMGGSNPYLKGFAASNNGGDFNQLFTQSWSYYGVTPNWAVNLYFTHEVPEPSSMLLVGTGILGGLGALRRSWRKP